MNKLLVVLAGLSLMLMPQVVKAEDMPAAPVMEEAAAPAADASAAVASEVMDSHMGNKICPVSGKEIGEMGEGTEVEYNGMKIKLCCPDCVEAFNKDPEGYVKMLKEKMAAEAPAVDAATMEAAPAVEAPVAQ